MPVLSVIVPVFNEKNTVSEIKRQILGVVLPEGISREVIFIDDGSTDGTRDILKQFSESNVTVLFHDINQGKGAAVITGLKKSKGDMVVIQDADLEYDPAEYNKLLKPIIDGKADVVYGSRFLGGESRRVLYYWHYVGNKILTQLSNMFTNLNLSDMETCYKMFNRRVVDDIKDKLVSVRFGIEPEMTARVKRYRVYEVGISYSGRTYQEGKKIGWKDGVSALWCIIKFNILH